MPVRIAFIWKRGITFIAVGLMMEHSQVTVEAAQKIMDKIVKSRHRVAAFTNNGGMEYMTTDSKRFEYRFVKNPQTLIGIYDSKVPDGDLLDDLESAGIR
jgi:hypothetical protein